MILCDIVIVLIDVVYVVYLSFLWLLHVAPPFLANLFGIFVD